MPLPAWLPALIVIDPWTERTFDDLYAIFTVDFKHSRPVLEGYEVWYFSEQEGGKEVIFWHLTHRDDKVAGDRLPDPRRCERLRWVRCLIENCLLQAEILKWDFQESNGTIHTYVWLVDHDFVVIMKKYPDGKRRLITSYHVDQNGKRKTFESKYKRRIT